MTLSPVVLVTGGAGYVGSHVVLALREAGLPVAVLDDLSTGKAEAVPPDVPLLPGSTGDTALVRAALRRHRVGAVIHLAASLVVPESVSNPLGYWRNNVANTLALVDACVAEGVSRLVFSSTAAVYGVPDALPVDEDAPCRPINPYGASKHAAERLLRDAGAAHGLAVVVLRYFNVARADPAGRAGQRAAGATHLIKVVCEAALGLRPALAVFGADYDTPDGTGVRDYVHVSDLARARGRAAPLGAGRRERGAQLRLWPGPHRPRGAARGGARGGPARAGADGAAPAGRSARVGGPCGAYRRGAGLAPSLRRPEPDRVQRPGVGAAHGRGARLPSAGTGLT
jgi:UDP-glucose 4-epimerase